MYTNTKLALCDVARARVAKERPVIFGGSDLLRLKPGDGQVRCNGSRARHMADERVERVLDVVASAKAVQRALVGRERGVDEGHVVLDIAGQYGVQNDLRVHLLFVS